VRHPYGISEPFPPLNLPMHNLQIMNPSKQAELALARSGLTFTVVRPGGLKSRLRQGESSAGNIVFGRPNTYGFPPLRKSGSILRSQVWRPHSREGRWRCDCSTGHNRNEALGLGLLHRALANQAGLVRPQPLPVLGAQLPFTPTHLPALLLPLVHQPAINSTLTSSPPTHLYSNVILVSLAHCTRWPR
jgi:hypothetical protein